MNYKRINGRAKDVHLNEIDQKLPTTCIVHEALAELVGGPYIRKLDGTPSGGRSATFPRYSYLVGNKKYILDVKGVGIVSGAEYVGAKEGLIYNNVIHGKPIGGQHPMNAIDALHNSLDCEFDGDGFRLHNFYKFYIAPTILVTYLPKNYLRRIFRLKLKNDRPNYWRDREDLEHALDDDITSIAQEKRLLPSTIRASSPKFFERIKRKPLNEIDRFMKNFLDTSLSQFLLPITSAKNSKYSNLYVLSYYTDTSPWADVVVDEKGICHFVDLEELLVNRERAVNSAKEMMNGSMCEVFNNLIPDLLEIIKIIKEKEGEQNKNLFKETIELLKAANHPSVRFKEEPGNRLKLIVENDNVHLKLTRTHKIYS